MVARLHPFALVASFCLVLATATTLLAAEKQPVGDWRHYSGDKGSMKYAPLDQINAENASKMKILWTWDSPDIPIQDKNRRLFSFAHEYTPLAVGGILYTSTSLAQVAAIDGATGETLWVFNPKAYEAGRPTNLGFVHRGIDYWTDGKEERLFLAAHDGYLYAIDAKTGKGISEFGEGGRVNVAAGIEGAQAPENYTITSPPLVCRDVVAVGSSINDGPQQKEAPKGDVQAYDVRTGKPAWTFHTIPREGEFGNETWENDSWKYTGNTNLWTLMSADEELGYFYFPLSTPTNDWYGGQRHGDNLFAESLVCVEAKTGKRVWHFQTVHHGVWDYDLPAAPILCDIKVDGKEIPAVAQITKTGFTFVFNRKTGEPVWPIEEKQVPPSAVPGEKLSPTQPVPTKPAPYELQGATEENLIDFTPELKAEAKKLLDAFDHGPLFTPPTEKGTINLPGWAGGANWWGAAFDPETGMLYVPSISAPISVKLQRPDPKRSNLTFVRGGGAFGQPVNGPKGLPLFKPPWGRITAIDLNTGDHAWMVPHGDGPREKVSELVGKDVGPLGSGGGGPVLTKSLLFIGQGSAGRGGRSGGGGAVLRAFDKANGKVVAEVQLPAAPSGTPMTYMAGDKQFVVVATSDRKLVAIGLE